jgi:hypothetical protein
MRYCGCCVLLAASFLVAARFAQRIRTRAARSVVPLARYGSIGASVLSVEPPAIRGGRAVLKLQEGGWGEPLAAALPLRAIRGRASAIADATPFNVAYDIYCLPDLSIYAEQFRRTFL